MDEQFRNYLEEQIDLRRPCSIRFRDVEGAVAEIRAHILRLEQVAHRWMLETDAGIHIGVDQLIEVNGRPAAHFS